LSDPANLRVSDADRDLLAQELREHMVAGRLTQHELEDRLERAYGAATRGELDAVKADLPMSAASLQRAISERRARLRRRLLQEGSGGATASAVCVGVWIANGADGSFWPIWVIVFTMLPLVRGMWQLYGPAPDPEAVEASVQRTRARRLDRERRRARRHRELPR
jgi:hypothetical protein